MTNLDKKPYEISLWEDELVYIITTEENEDPHEVTTLPKSGYTIRNQYVKENCLVLIGSNTLNTPIRAFEPRLTQQVTGANTLTFQIYSKYYDEDEEEFKDNPFIGLLVNERKVKLHYNNKWFEFIIKEIQEKSDGNIFTYTCKDLYINELSKSGYNLEFATELENNQGTVTELAKVILEETDWEVGTSDLIQQTEKETLYSCVINKSLDAICLSDFSYGDVSYKKGEIKKTKPGSTIYAFYSSYVNKENPLTILLSEDGKYLKDENGIILNSPNWAISVAAADYDSTFEKTEISATYFGERLISKHISKYVSEIDKYCSVYEKEKEEGKKYYAFSETEYASVSEIQNLLTNSSNFISTNGWVGVGDSSVILGYTTNGKPALKLDFGTSGKVVNTGLYDNRNITRGFIAGEEYIFAIKGENNITDIAGITGAQVEASHAGVGPIILFNFTEANKIAGLDKYKIFSAKCTTSISYNDLLKHDINFYVFGNKAAATADDETITITDAKLFRKVTGANGNIIIPDLEDSINSIIKTKYYFFPCSLIDGVSPRKIFSTDDITFTAVLYENDEAFKDFKPVKSTDYEKIRSITGSKSNRFNLIQELCEAFECWASFTIEHDEKGKVKYSYEKVTLNKDNRIEGKTYYIIKNADADVSKDINFRFATEKDLSDSNEVFYEKKYEKKVSFKRFIGKENPVGFRYGINLKSIQRTINSDQIVSKLIVEPNTNKYAENGSCTIQTSVLNPTGENVLYNFEYYIRHNLLDREALFNDLYGTNSGLGLYPKLRDWNNEAAPLINESISISGTLNTLNSRKSVYEAMIAESDRLYEEAISEIVASTGLDRDTAKTLTEAGLDANGLALNDHAKDYIRKRKRAKSTKEDYNNLLTNITFLITGYNEKIAEIDETLEGITKKKKALNSEFYKRYSRYIQEGTWTSSEHIDDEDYYLDSQMVSYTSAFPKVTYTINVIEISQVEGFEPYFFEIGDKTYIEDTEFFGWNVDGRPYQEEIVVSEVSYGLDDPSKNTIKVQNYKTQFEDLFQRITAATQSLQYHEGEYQRAASAINPDGSIKSSLLQDSMDKNSLVIKNAKNESVVWDETGITITNFLNPNNIVRLVSGGIVLSTNGGRTWTTGITGEGINANVITTGRLDTNRIRIFNENYQTFEWNSNGINAYMLQENNVPDYTKFVRFNQYGLFGYTGSKPEEELVSIDDVIDNSIFSLTWRGLTLNLPSGQTAPIINTPNFKVYGNGDVVIDGGTISWKESSTDTTGINPPSINILPDLDKYTKDIKDQIDGKAETWYQSTPPDENWSDEDKEKHVGDLWHDTENNKTYLYVKEDNTYSWKEADGVPQDVFDKIDGKSTIYTTLSELVKPENGDLLIPSKTHDYSGVTYTKGKVYRYNGTDWLEVDYTDDSTVNDLKTQLGYKKIESTEIGEKYVISPYIVGGTLLIKAEDGTTSAEITSAGKLICNGAEVNGTLKASTIEGNLTGGSNSAILGPELGIGGTAVSTKNPANGKFYVDSAGNVTMSGNIILSGTITWNNDTNPTKVLYHAKKSNGSIPSIPSGNYNTDYNNTGSSSWHKNLSTDDYYASYSYNNGAAGSWTPVIKIRGEDGTDGEDGAQGAPGKDAVLPNWITETVIGSNYVSTPLLQANYIELGGVFKVGDYGYIGPATGSSGGTNTTYGVAMSTSGNVIDFNSTSSPYVIVTTAGTRMSCNNHGLYVADGGVGIVVNGEAMWLSKYIKDTVPAGLSQNEVITLVANTVDSSYINSSILPTTITNIINEGYITNIIDEGYITNIINSDYINNNIDQFVIRDIIDDYLGQ